MKRVRGDLWSFHPTHWIVVPTNLGWNRRGENIMGAGVAKQARERFPHLPKVWGEHVRVGARVTCTFAVDSESRCIFFPTKPLDAQRPADSWRRQSDLALIAQSAATLAAWCPSNGFTGRQVALPL